MITKSFKIFEGIDRETQRRLHNEGVPDWDEFLKRDKITGIPESLKTEVDDKIKIYKSELDKGNFDFFCDFPPSDHWRLYEIIKKEGQICYMDIETTGLQFFNDEITVVGIYDGKKYECLVSGKDLNKENLEKLFAPFRMFVTHYGLKFDIPFLKLKFPDLELNRLHFDVSFVARKLGIGNNLKEIEKKLEVWREGHIVGITGFRTVQLWDEYQEGNEKSLELLIDHNRGDAVNLREVADKIFEYLVKIDY